MRLLSLTFFLLITLAGFAQETKLYDVEADASKQIAAAIKEANAQNKNVMIQAGGNWCSWCIKFNKFTIADAQIDSIIKASYVLVHLNYSKENKNEATFASLGFPQRFGFPSFIILDKTGQRLHTQNSSYLEDGKGSYDRNTVFEFLQAWTPWALDPQTYQATK
ncbi:MAG: thioredoxin family protein [Saprospiraceae bacterium]